MGSFHFKISHSVLYVFILIFAILILRPSAPIPNEKAVELEIKNRKERINEYCKNIDQNKTINLGEYHFIENLPRPLIFCTPKKVGSLSLGAYFTNYVDEEDQMSWILGPINDTRENIFLSRKPLKAMITRHPLERFASTFIHLFKTGLEDFDKFLCAKGSDCKVTQNAYLAQKIIEQLRPGAAPSYKDPDLRFREFVTFVIDSEGRFGELKREMKKDYPGMATHWEPYHR